MTAGIDACLFLGEDEFSADYQLYDIAIGNNGDIRTQDFFDTAIFVSLFAEKRANAAEVLDPRLRRGWIGNESTPDFEIGSKIWLYEQSRLTRTVLNGIQDAARESLTWLVTEGFAVSINQVTATLVSGTVRLSVTITRPNGQVEKRHYNLWENTAAKVADITFGPDITLSYFAGFDEINLFTDSGSPEYPVKVYVTIYGARRANSGFAALRTGVGWHEHSEIYIFAHHLIQGHGGNGGDGECIGVSGDVGGGGGGGAGSANGIGGDGFGTSASDGENGTNVAPGDPGAGETGTGTVGAVGAVAGSPGGNAIELEHPVKIRNVGFGILAGGGGGGGGKATEIGGKGGEWGQSGEDGPLGGASGGAGGLAIKTNGHEVTFLHRGVIFGDVT